MRTGALPSYVIPKSSTTSTAWSTYTSPAKEIRVLRAHLSRQQAMQTRASKAAGGESPRRRHEFEAMHHLRPKFPLSGLLADGGNLEDTWREWVDIEVFQVLQWHQPHP